jgi:hypothetical protein
MGRFFLFVEDQNGGRDDRCPQAAFVAHGGLGDICSADDLVGYPVNLFFLVPGTIGVEFDVERGGQHLGSEFFCVVTGGVFSLSERVVFAEIAVGVAVGGNGHANARRQEAVRLVGGILGHDGKDHLARA